MGSMRTPLPCSSSLAVGLPRRRPPRRGRDHGDRRGWLRSRRGSCARRSPRRAIRPVLARIPGRTRVGTPRNSTRPTPRTVSQGDIGARKTPGYRYMKMVSQSRAATETRFPNPSATGCVDMMPAALQHSTRAKSTRHGRTSINNHTRAWSGPGALHQKLKHIGAMNNEGARYHKVFTVAERLGTFAVISRFTRSTQHGGDERPTCFGAPRKAPTGSWRRARRGGCVRRGGSRRCRRAASA